ncbi:MAG: hypothetical protein EB015_18230 [Methylocystaceae bacterium]|nr:hypothetical protein [Methylocystaceae bacterium]
MDLGIFGKLIENVAPTIATALGGPVAGMAVKALSSALLGHDGGSEDDIKAALATATPDQIAAIRKVDADFKVQMKQLDIDLVKIAADDRISARQMAIATHDLTPRILAFVIVVSWGFFQHFVVTHDVSQGMRELIIRVLGTLDGALMLVLSYYFGSSHQHSSNGEGK